MLVGRHHPVLLLVLTASGLEHRRPPPLEPDDCLQMLPFLSLELLRLLGKLIPPLDVARLLAALGQHVVELIERINLDFSEPGRLGPGALRCSSALRCSPALRCRVAANLAIPAFLGRKNAPDFLRQVANPPQQRRMFALPHACIFAAMPRPGLK